MNLHVVIIALTSLTLKTEVLNSNSDACQFDWEFRLKINSKLLFQYQDILIK